MMCAMEENGRNLARGFVIFNRVSRKGLAGKVTFEQKHIYVFCSCIFLYIKEKRKSEDSEKKITCYESRIMVP